MRIAATTESNTRPTEPINNKVVPQKWTFAIYFGIFSKLSKHLKNKKITCREKRDKRRERCGMCHASIEHYIS